MMFKKKILSGLLAAALSCTSMAAQAAEVSDTEYVSMGDVDDTVNWEIDDYADNIKEIYKMDYPEQADVIDEIVDGFLQDSEFISIFERIGGSAFLIVEESLHDVLDPDIMPIIGDGNLYYTNNNIPLISQKSGYSDGAAAAVLMALYGCGKYTYPNSDAFNTARQNALINEMSWDSNKKTTVGEVTRTMRRYADTSNGFDFQTKYYSSLTKAVNAIAIGLSMNTAPIVRIPDGSSYYYGVITQLEYNEETIRLIDPRTATIRDITFDGFETMINQNNKIIWMSVYAPDKSGEAMEKVRAQYPDGGYYTINGSACLKHIPPTTCGNCVEFDGGWQCSGFARKVFSMVKGRSYLNSDDVKTFIQDKSADGIAKKYLQGLSTGAYVRVNTNAEGYVDKGHSIAIVSTSPTGISYTNANYDYCCGIGYETKTWEEFAGIYKKIHFYVD